MKKLLTILSFIVLSNIGKSQIIKDTLFLNRDSIIWDNPIGRFSVETLQSDTLKVLMLCSKEGQTTTFVIKGVAVVTKWLWSFNDGPTQHVKYFGERMVVLPKDFIVWQHKERKQ